MREVWCLPRMRAAAPESSLECVATLDTLGDHPKITVFFWYIKSFESSVAAHPSLLFGVMTGMKTMPS